ncbi:MAG TPA: helix-turn-helix domain-containing protein [Acidimicrobiales bacterium]
MKLEAAARWLWAYLEAKPGLSESSNITVRDGKRAGHTESTLRSAKRKLKVDHYFHGRYSSANETYPESRWSLQTEPSIAHFNKTFDWQPRPRRKGWADKYAGVEFAELNVEDLAPERPPTPEVKANENYREKVARDIEVVAHHLASRPWPGDNGARNARVMAAVLRRLAQQNSLRTKINFWNFSDECGMPTWGSVKKALYDLESDGWIGFTLGTPSRGLYDSEGPLGKASIIKLARKPGSANYPANRLPNAARDEFTSGELNDAGYLLMMRVLFEGKTSGFTRPVLERLTGISASTIQRRMRTMTAMGLVEKDGRGRWSFVNPEQVLDEGNDSKVRERREKRLRLAKGG